MSYIQQILNKRLGGGSSGMVRPGKKTLESPKKPEPEPVVAPPPVVKNARGAGRKKTFKTAEEREQAKQKVIEQLSRKGNKAEEDIETIKEISCSSNKTEINDEIKVTKRKLDLLKSSYVMCED